MSIIDDHNVHEIILCKRPLVSIFFAILRFVLRVLIVIAMLSVSLVSSLLVLQNFTTARKSGNILSKY